ncbi:MAG: glycoside hydrolase family 15 protein [Planctomycetes bacterium]|nr:glycoside hydrolase family 15 protein [Planctomycetota bacterium]
MKLAIIGNCQYSALIDPKARVRWLCWPRFDSSFVLGGLLDEEKGGHFEVGAADRARTTQSYLENTNVLRTTFRTSRGSFEVIDFAPRFQEHERYYRPTMLVRIVRRLAGRPLVRVRCEPVHDYGQAQPHASWGSNHIQFHFTDPRISLRLTTNAPLTYLTRGTPFLLTGPLYLVLTWGEPLEAPLATTCETLLQRTVSYWRKWVRNCALPPDYQREVIRSALTLKLHQFDDTGAIIAATTTSLPEGPGTGRTWDYRYCWLRDAYFTLSAFRRLSHFDEMERFIGYLHNLARLHPGRLQPVYGIGGETDLQERTLGHLAGYRNQGPVRIGNAAHAHQQNDVYGEMILAIAPLFLDHRFEGSPMQNPDRLLRQLVAAIEARMTQPDAGIWEFRNKRQHHTFTLLMHWAGARQAGRIARLRRQTGLARRAERIALWARSTILRGSWRRGARFFAQAVGSREPDASLALMSSLGFLAPDDPRTRSHLEGLARSLRAGHGLLHRYVHADDFGKSRAIFTVCNFWYVETLAQVGEKGRARELFERLLGYANPLGLFSEDLWLPTGEQWGNFPQTYSHVGLIHAANALSRPWE